MRYLLYAPQTKHLPSRIRVARSSLRQAGSDTESQAESYISCSGWITSEPPNGMASLSRASVERHLDCELPASNNLVQDIKSCFIYHVICGSMLLHCHRVVNKGCCFSPSASLQFLCLGIHRTQLFAFIAPTFVTGHGNTGADT